MTISFSLFFPSEIDPNSLNGTFQGSAIATSGVASVSYSLPFDNFTALLSLSNGVITSWNIDIFDSSSRSCGLGIVQYCRFSSSPQSGDHVRAYTGYFGAYYGADTNAVGTWSAVPGPIVGAGLPGLGFLIVLAWMRRNLKRVRVGG
jgi:hypothetical protein